MERIIKIDVFVSSPSDVTAEREAALRVIERLNRLSILRDRYYLKPLAYEREVAPGVGEPAQTIVDRAMKAEESDIFICILCARMGTPFVDPATQRQYQSGTQYEFLCAYQAKQEHGKPFILLYRKTEEPADADPEQKALVGKFFNQFAPGGQFQGLYQRFATTDQFEDMLFYHIERIITEHMLKLADTNYLSAPERPQVQEEDRRIDAAVPGWVKLGNSTEVRAQLCLPDSPGLRALLPHKADAQGAISTKDVKNSTLAIAFPVDPATKKLQSIHLIVSVIAPDFTPRESSHEIVLSPQADSGLLTFEITPNRQADYSIIHLVVKQPLTGRSIITLGSVVLTTKIATAAGIAAGAQALWNLLSMPLTATLMTAARHRGAQDGTSADSGQLDEARLTEDTVKRANQLREAAVKLAQAGNDRAKAAFGEALTAAREVSDPYQLAPILRKLALALSQAKDRRASRVFDEAIAAAEAIPAPTERASALGKLGSVLAQVGDDRATQVLDTSLDSAYAISDPIKQVEILCEIGEASARAHYPRVQSVFDEAMRIADTITDSQKQMIARGTVKQTLAQAKQSYPASFK